MLGRKIIKVPYIDQTLEWPTGCECVSTVMLLQYLGYDISVEDFVDRYVKKEPFTEKEGKLYGADPRIRFVGHPKDPDSMGCYAPVICEALNAFLKEKQTAFGKTEKMAVRKAHDLTGVPTEELLEKYIDRDMPVIFWASIDLKEPVYGPDWIVGETGETFSWISNEHCMLLVGYDDTHYYFNDPWHNHGCIAYDRELVEARHKVQYSMAVSVCFPEPEKGMDQNRLLHKLTEYSASDAYPFHMPGHKRSQDIPGMEPFFAIDITEIDGFDNLHEAEGILREIEKQAAELYKAEDAFLSVNGSTGGVLAAMMSQIPRGSAVIMGRGAHKSVYHGLYLQQLTPIYLQAETLPYEIPGALQPEQIGQAMEQHPEAKAVLVTSPTYEGLMLDIEKIAQEVHRRGGILLVDGAHGAHLGFAECMEKNPINLGADVVVVSLHKTLPAMTQTALVLVGSNRVDKESLKQHLSILETSSPSYVLMTSMQESILFAGEQGETLLAQMAERSRALIETVKTECRHIRIVDGEKDLGITEKWDPGKLVITAAQGEMTGPEIYQYLRTEHHLQLEMATGTYALAMLSMMDPPEAYERLEKALLALDQKIDVKKRDRNDDTIAEAAGDPVQQDLPAVKIPLWQALVKKGREIPLKDTLGTISGSFVGLYPPGIPLLVPGEQVDLSRHHTICTWLNKGLHVQGLVEREGTLFLKVIEP